MKRTYSETEKYELVKRYHDGEHATDICLQNNIPRSTFYTWLKPYKTTCTRTGQDVSAAELAKMKKRVQKLEQTVEVLKKLIVRYHHHLKKNSTNWNHCMVSIAYMSCVRHSKFQGVHFTTTCSVINERIVVIKHGGIY